jgi:dihydroceramidase
VRGKNGYSWKFDSPSVALLILGITSFVYHATLRQITQFADDLSMLILAASFCQSVFTVGQSPNVSRIISTLILVGVTTLSVVYVRSGDILIHVYGFSSMILLLFPRILYIAYYSNLSQERRSKLLRKAAKAVVVLTVGYTLWQVDLELGFDLRKIRSAIGLPWAWVLELHGWWHVLTAISANMFILLLRELHI